MASEKYPNTKKRCHAGKLFTYNTRFVPTYTEDYCHQPLPSVQHPVPHLYPSRNVPHTLQGFSVWRLPNNLDPLMDHAIEETAQLIPDQLIQNCTERVSTYQRDYAIKRPRKLVSSTAMKPARMLTPSEYLKPSTTRYGCSKGIVRAAKGIIPAVVYTELPSTVLYQSRYESEYASGDKTKSVQFQLPKII